MASPQYDLSNSREAIAVSQPESGVLSTWPSSQPPRHPQTTSTLLKIYEDQSAQGFRVLAVAYRTVATKARYTTDDEADLILAGFLSFADPILPETAETIALLRQDGIAIRILSGDSGLVAGHICTEAGIPFSHVVLGQNVDGMTDRALGHIAESTSVFAWLSPAQKLRIVSALRRRGHIVDYIGDGINDAPSLRAADVA